VKTVKNISRRFNMVAACFTVFGLSFLPMQPVTRIEGQLGNICVVALGLIFWLSFILGTINAIRLGVENRAFIRNCGLSYRRYAGFFRFFSNRRAVAADLMLIASLAYTAAVFILSPEKQIMYFIAWCVLTISLSFHWLYNSKAYITINTNN